MRAPANVISAKLDGDQLPALLPSWNPPDKLYYFFLLFIVLKNLVKFFLYFILSWNLIILTKRRACPGASAVVSPLTWKKSLQA